MSKPVVVPAPGPGTWTFNIPKSHILPTSSQPSVGRPFGLSLTLRLLTLCQQPLDTDWAKRYITNPWSQFTLVVQMLPLPILRISDIGTSAKLTTLCMYVPKSNHFAEWVLNKFFPSNWFFVPSGVQNGARVYFAWCLLGTSGILRIFWPTLRMAFMGLQNGAVSLILCHCKVT